MTTGSLWRNIWQLSWPMLLIMIFNFFVGFVDVYVAGFISPEVQAAVGFVSLLYFFVIIIANAISIGTVALVSRAIGGGDFKRALEVARQSLIFGCLVAAVLTLVGIFLSREIYGHYREKLYFSDKHMKAAAEHLRRVRVQVREIERRAKGSAPLEDDRARGIREAFRSHMDQDLEMRKAFDGLSQELEAVKFGDIRPVAAAAIIAVLREIDRVLNVIF